MAEFNFDAAKQVLDNGIAEAQSYLENPEKIDGLLDSLKAQMSNLPDTVSGAFANVPTLAAMVKSFVTKEYTDIPVKTIASVVAAFLYLVKGKDLIPDNIPLLGLVDDVAIVTAVLKINEPEFEAYKAWQVSKDAGVETL